MLAQRIAEKTNTVITDYITGTRYTPRPRHHMPRIGDTVRNMATGEIGTLYAYCDDRYAIWNPTKVAYVVDIVDGETVTDHWAVNEIEVVMRGYHA